MDEEKYVKLSWKDWVYFAIFFIIFVAMGFIFIDFILPHIKWLNDLIHDAFYLAIFLIIMFFYGVFFSSITYLSNKLIPS